MKKTIQYVGGLGDALLSMFQSDMYTCLDQLPPGDVAQIVAVTVTPHMLEVFEYHPKRDQLELLQFPLEFPWDENAREKHGIGGVREHQLEPRGEAPVVWYPGPQDAPVLAQVEELKPYVVFALSAGHPSRNVPPLIANHAADVALSLGFNVVLIGRNYPMISPLCLWERGEVEIVPRPGVMNTVDLLTVPGSYRVVEGAAAAFCCHSAPCLLAWFRRIPAFTLYHDYSMLDATTERFYFGKDYPESVTRRFKEWKPEEFSAFLSKVRERA